jgi:hypothetical protein
MVRGVVFRARLTRAARAVACTVVIAGLAWAIHAETTFPTITTTLRAVALVPTAVMELALLAGLWRLWVVCLIAGESGVIARNFRGDIRLRRTEIREVFAVLGAAGCHVALRLKIGDEIHLDGLAFATPRRTHQAVEEISRALGLSLRDEP